MVIPIDFTINTLVSLPWGESVTSDISTIVTEFLNRFVVLDIKDKKVDIITETNFRCKRLEDSILEPATIAQLENPQRQLK